MNVKEVLSAQLNACHNQNTWFVSLLNAVEGVTEEQARWKPDEATNSIFEIVNHLIFYNQRHLNRLQNIDDDKNVVSNTFKNKDGLTWDEAVNRIDEIMSQWKNVVEQTDDAQLNNWAGVIAHLTIHTTYHTGQIVYIRKLQGSWDSKEGVQG